MRIDGAELPAGAELVADVGIVGGGPAGLVLAHALSERGLDVCLLESGDSRPTRIGRRLSRGISIGREYPPLDRARVRAIAGSANHWYTPGKTGWSPDGGMRSRRLDAIDLSRREWVPFSGWPFGAQELAPYYERAEALCGLAGSPEGTPPDALDLPGDTFTSIRHRFATVGTFRALSENVIARRRVTLVTNTTATTLERDALQHGRINHVTALTSRRRPVSLSARVFVLAAGGLENARLLLLSRDEAGIALGNSHDLVGRFFMEHLQVDAGIIEPASTDLLEHSDFYTRWRGAFDSVGVISLTGAAQEREGILNVDLAPVVTYAPFYSRAFFAALRARERLAFGRPPVDSIEEAGALVSAIKAYARAAWISKVGRLPGRRDVFGLVAMAEQAPSPASRVLLSREVDDFGQQRLALDWRTGELETRSITRALTLLDEALQAGGLGRLRLFESTPHLKWGWHHMGTTRMHADPAHGVVDADCRLHEASNLFLAGSSIFPTGGAATVTLSIVALALRLADHIAALAAPPRSEMRRA